MTHVRPSFCICVCLKERETEKEKESVENYVFINEACIGVVSANNYPPPITSSAVLLPWEGRDCNIWHTARFEHMESPKLGVASLPTQTKKWKLGRGLDTVCNCIALTITLGAAGQSKQYLCKTQWGNRCVAAGYKGRCRKGRVWPDVRYVKSMCRCVSLEEYT